MFELVGIEELNFKDQQTGEQIVGKRIHFITAPDPDKRNYTTGKVCGNKFFKAGSAIPSVLQCGKNYEFIMTYTGGKTPKLVGFKEIKA